MERPGIIFELRNADGLSLYTPCVFPMPQPPADWNSPPLEFRAIPEPVPIHSSPIPEPQAR
jgi:hypothetical protein